MIISKISGFRQISLKIAQRYASTETILSATPKTAPFGPSPIFI
jgi:hypothetical protein